MCILEKLNFKISRGTMPPDPPSLIVSSAPDTIWAGLTELLSPGLLFEYFQSVILTIILRTQ